MEETVFLDKYIDSLHKPEESLILRYYKGMPFNNLNKNDFKAVSIKEGARIFEFINYKGVAVYIVDETTLMAGGTFKALEACFTTALCRKNKYGKIVFSSGANIGSALTIYGQKLGIETFFFHPKSTSWKIDGKIFNSPKTHLISVDKPEKEVKKAALLFAELSGIKHVPEIDWRLTATGLRAFYVFEYSLKNKIQFNWISQAVCAGYGAIGFYNIAKKFIQEGGINKKKVPKFLGVQQKALSPMVKAWKNKHSQILPQDIVSSSAKLFSPALYNTNPDKSYSLLYKHLLNFGGNLLTLNKKDYKIYLPLLLKALAKNGINLNTRKINGKDVILENAGLVGLGGTFKAIDEGIIRKGEIVLSFLTGGVSGYSGKQAAAEFEIKQEDDLKNALKKYLSILKVRHET